MWMPGLMRLQSVSVERNTVASSLRVTQMADCSDCLKRLTQLNIKLRARLTSFHFLTESYQQLCPCVLQGEISPDPESNR